jgi:hypothetical protein
VTAHAWTPTAYSMEEGCFTLRVRMLAPGQWEFDASRGGIVEERGQTFSAEQAQINARLDMLMVLQREAEAEDDPESDEPRDPRDDDDRAYQGAVDNHEIPRAGEWDL